MDVRRGGVATPDGYRFELTGGRACLDLANTVDERPADDPRELLAGYEDLLDWALQAGLLRPAEVRRLARRARRRPGAAAAVLRRARTLREALFALFRAVARGARPPAAALAALNAELPRALAHLQVAAERGGAGWTWEAGDDDLDTMLWPVAHDAAELLTSAERSRVRECASDACAWLFVDRSRNRSRRWCDMTVCGNRAKARRHYRRHRGRAD